MKDEHISVLILSILLYKSIESEHSSEVLFIRMKISSHTSTHNFLLLMCTCALFALGVRINFDTPSVIKYKQTFTF
jgi:hypothetical protein